MRPLTIIATSLLVLTACSNQNKVTHHESVVEAAAYPVPSGAPVAQQKRRYMAKHMAADSLIHATPELMVNTENYKHFDNNSIKSAQENPVSTFSIDVDTGAYANVRRFLKQGQLPPEDAVRVEELINYFTYQYPIPASTEQPFSVTTELVQTPWNENTHLLQIGLQGFKPEMTTLPAANLVFLMDVSGSMNSDDKLGLLKKSLILLSKQLSKQDRVSMVVYAGASGVVLEPTPGNETATITAALNKLQAGGSTNGASGIELAYQMAEQAFIKGGINRVLLATDGDFNVGIVDFEQLKDMVERKRKTGIALTTLGFGQGNYNDHLMEQLADAGNGNYAYIDSILEAQKVLVTERAATLMTIAKDVKIQVEFNPAAVAEYRLIGYENRALKREDFNNDKVDAGEIGAGHTVTALYEIAFTNSKGRRLEDLRYTTVKTEQANSNELGLLRLRYKQPTADSSQLIEHILDKQQLLAKARQPSNNIQFAAAVAAFGQQLRGGQYLETYNFDKIVTLAQQSSTHDPHGLKGEFIQLVGLAKTLEK